MKLVTYSVDGGEPRVGSLEGDEIRPLAHEDMIEFIESGGSPEPGEDTVPLGEARIHAPIAGPEKIIGIGLNYEDHAAETGADIPEKPIVFAKYANSVIGPGETVRIPPITEQADYEAELAVIIGKTARNVPESEALDHVFGYTNANDVSSRDLQFSEGGQWTRSKSIDTFCPIGPYIATKDEIEDPARPLHQVHSQRRGHAGRDDVQDDLLRRRARLLPLPGHDARSRRRHQSRARPLASARPATRRSGSKTGTR